MNGWVLRMVAKAAGLESATRRRVLPVRSGSRGKGEGERGNAIPSAYGRSNRSWRISGLIDTSEITSALVRFPDSVIQSRRSTYG